MDGKFSSIGVIFRDFGGRAELRYAADLAVLLDVPLNVYAEHPAGDSPDRFADEVKRRVRLEAAPGLPAELYGSCRLAAGDLRGFPFPDTEILVSNELAHLRRDVSVLAPFGEDRLFGRGRGPMMMPFGNGDSGRWAAGYALPLAERLGLPVQFWHPTRRNPAVTNSEPAMHISPPAAELLRSLQKQARALKVPCRGVIEITDGVVEGLVRFALRERCVLIVMTRGLNTGMGRYGDTLLDRASPVPLLMVGRKELR